MKLIPLASTMWNASVPMASLMLFDILCALWSVGQITGEAQEPGHCRSNTSPGPSPTDDGVTPMRKPEVNLDRGKGRLLPSEDP